MLVIFYYCAAFDVAYLVWADWPPVGPHATAFFSDLARVSAALLAMWLFIGWYGRRKGRQVKQARRFMEELEC